MPVRRPAMPALAGVAGALAAALLLAPAAAAQAPMRSVSAVGSARVAVNRGVAQNSRAIATAVEAARERAIRRAIANAREEAARLAAAGGLTLGGTTIRRRDARGVLRRTGRFRRRFGCRVPGEVNIVVRATFAAG